MEKDSREIFQKLKKDISDFVELKLELLKLNTYERVGKIVMLLSYGIIILLLVLLALLFICLALGFYLGVVFNSLWVGFGIIAIFYLLLILLVVSCRHQIKKKILNLVIAAFISKKGGDNISKNNHETTNDTDSTLDTHTTIAT